ncbi:glycosyltransferase family A protein [Pedobacter gandavensis]|uniref:glycosyltransferase family 2 protein n=1 Tax=Pedobacter gandavensis TaxID=2679963 RepID=UPI00293069FD|nr:glycosyltransferase family A protein [Pedobacter gandavensis]
MMNQYRPLVSCIMVTGSNLQMIRNSISYFLDQNYPYKELIIIDDGHTCLKDKIQSYPHVHYFHLDSAASSASKRNFGIFQSQGEIIMHWNDEDWYAPDWVYRQSNTLIFTQIHICGLHTASAKRSDESYYQRLYGKSKTRIYSMAPSTLCYLRSFWDKYPIKDILNMEDADFVRNSGGLVYCHTYSAGYLEAFHKADKNISFEDKEERAEMINRRKASQQPYQRPSIHVRNEYAWIIPVTCILCTHNGEEHLPHAIENLLYQDYLDIELLIIETGTSCCSQLIPYHKKISYISYVPSATIGEMKNIACEKAHGQIILHWDEQDTYSFDWITHQVSSLISLGADASGLDKFIVHTKDVGKTLMVKDPINKKGWVYGATLVYWKQLWKMFKFKALQMGEDDDFLNRSKAFVYPHDYTKGFIANIGERGQSHL